MSHVSATVKELDMGEFCQRVQMKSEKGKKSTMLILTIAKEFNRREVE